MRDEKSNYLTNRTPGKGVSAIPDSSNEERNANFENNNETKSAAKLFVEKTVVEKLFTSKEERPFHIHKILGFTCLVSFMYRFAHLGKRDGNFGPHVGTLFFVVHHFLLNASSFIFVIPQIRIRDGGYRIWPEYRFHSLVFTSRSLACMLLIWWQQKYNSNITRYHYYYYHHLINLAIVLATCAGADWGSYIQGKEYQYNTVRGTQYIDPLEKWFASEAQFVLTGICLVGIPRFTMHLVAVSIIQGNAFLMTLRRKNVASHNTLVAIYGAMLLAAFAILIWDDQFIRQTLIAATYGQMGVFLRMGPLHLNKYLLWTIFGLNWYWVCVTGIVRPYNSLFWLFAFAMMKGICLVLAFKKRYENPNETRNSLMFWMVIVSHVIMYTYLVIGNWNLLARAIRQLQVSS